MAANKFVPQANRALRSYNMYLNVRTSPRRSWLSRTPFISRIFKSSQPIHAEDSGEKTLSRPTSSSRSSSPTGKVSIPPRSSSNTSDLSPPQATNSNPSTGKGSRPTSPTHRSLPPIPPSANPRGELIFSSKVAPDFRDGYEKYRAAFERRREERKRLDDQGKWKWIPSFLQRVEPTPVARPSTSASSGRIKTLNRKNTEEGVRERLNSGVGTARRTGINPTKRPAARNRSASQTSIASIASNLSQQSQTSVNSMESAGGASNSEASGLSSEEEEVEELDDLGSESTNTAPKNRSSVNRPSISAPSQAGKGKANATNQAPPSGLPQEGLRVDTRPDLRDTSNSIQHDRSRGRRRSSMELVTKDIEIQDVEEDERRGRERTPSPVALLNSGSLSSSSSSTSGSSLGRRASSRSKSYRGANRSSSGGNGVSRSSSTSKPKALSNVEAVQSDSVEAETRIPVAGSSHDPNLMAVAAIGDVRSADAELTLREPSEPLEVGGVGTGDESDVGNEGQVSEEWIEVRRSGRRSANHSSG